MFHLLSKLLVIFLSPLTWVLVLLILALLFKSRKGKKGFLISALIILILFSNKFLLNEFAKRWDIRNYPEPGQKFNCAIVLGGFASEGPQGQAGHFNSSADRFIQALKLLEQKTAKTVMISGGNASIFKKNFLEADFAVAQLKLLNVPDSCILVENRSKNTLENARFSGLLLAEKKLPPPYLLITSAFHMRRALETFKSAGVEVVGYPCDYKAGCAPTQVDDFLPDLDTLALWKIYIKEVIGLLAYRLKS